jgi:hypothetical protein
MKITRLLVRLDALHEWTERRGGAAMNVVAAALKKAIADGAFERGDPTRIGKNVLRIGVDRTNPPTPRIGFEAKKAGFLREENPFAPGTAKHATWARSWDKEYWDIR